MHLFCPKAHVIWPYHKFTSGVKRIDPGKERKRRRYERRCCKGGNGCWNGDRWWSTVTGNNELGEKRPPSCCALGRRERHKYVRVAAGQIWTNFISWERNAYKIFNIQYNAFFSGIFTKFGNATISFVILVCLCPSAWNNSNPTGRIFTKFDIWVFFENLSRNFRFYRILTRITNTVHEELSNFMVKPQGTAVAQWLRCCATNRKVAVSIPDGIIGIFHWHNPSDRTIALGSIQTLTEMSTRIISWG